MFVVSNQGYRFYPFLSNLSILQNINEFVNEYQDNEQKDTKHDFYTSKHYLLISVIVNLQILKI